MLLQRNIGCISVTDTTLPMLLCCAGGVVFVVAVLFCCLFVCLFVFLLACFGRQGG